MANDSLATYRQFKPEATMLLGGCHTHTPRHSGAGRNPATSLRHSRAGGNPKSTHRKLASRQIALLSYKEKDKLGAEYPLTDVNKPIGISGYQLTQALPDNLTSSLPRIEEIEAELARDLGVGDE